LSFPYVTSIPLSDEADVGPDEKEIPPFGKSFEVDFCTVARSNNGWVIEENPFYDLVTFMKQIGVSE
jgi:hypothetical protein